MSARPFDDELASIAVSLPMVVRLNRHLVAERFERRGSEWFDRPEADWIAHNDSWFARLDSLWLRSRILLRFILNFHRDDEVYARQYWSQWHFPDGDDRKRLIYFEKQASEHIAHVIRKPETEPGLWSGMPRKVVEAYRLMVDRAPQENALVEALGEAVFVAEEALDGPLP